MKIIWLGGIVLPKIAKKEGLPITNANGWLVNLADILGTQENIQLVYLFDAENCFSGKTENYKYYGIQCDKSTKRKLGVEYKKQIKEIFDIEKPDVIHIWGTEGSHSLAVVEVCKELNILEKAVVSIQGLVGKYAQHYSAYLPHSVMHTFSIKDLLQGDVAKRMQEFRIRGEIESETLSIAKNVIGRTEWDMACVWDINPDAKYYFNNETLREEFYSGMWMYENCEKHSIFCSQAYNPIKGAHLIVAALPRIKKVYPDVKLYIGGKNYRSVPKWKRNGYENYLLTMIDSNGLQDNVCFTGFLSAEEMKNRYLQSNVFVSASSIENSPNSVGEAMILGMPVVASRVGGVHNMLTHGTEGYLYPADETYMLSYYVCKIFADVDLATKLGRNARNHALVTHDPKINLNTLIQIYVELSLNK